MLHAQPGRFEIIVEHTMPFLFARLFESEPAVDAGIVDEDVELPEHLYCPLDRPRPVRGSSGIKMDIGSCGAVGGDFLGQGRAQVIKNIGREDTRALGGDASDRLACRDRARACMAVRRELSVSALAIYISAQVIGAIVGVLAAHVIFRCGKPRPQHCRRP
jgi:hypothetical protein